MGRREDPNSPKDEEFDAEKHGKSPGSSTNDQHQEPKGGHAKGKGKK
ncbi:hypothetical protein [Nonomuraea sp. NPDC048901]